MAKEDTASSLLAFITCNNSCMTCYFAGEELISRVSQLKEFFAQHVDQTILEKLNEIIDEFMQRGIHK